MSKKKSPAFYLIAAVVLVLLIMHQDCWNWTNEKLVFGFIPVGLFYHACISIAASITWFVATKIAWPTDVEFVEETAGDEEGGN